MNREFQPLFVRLLTETHELFRPCRDWSNMGRVSAIAKRRREFFAVGLPFHAGDSAKQTERSTYRIEQTGVAIFSRSKGRQVAWRLTNAGDWQVRSLCGLPGQSEMLTALWCIDAYENAVRDKDANAVDEEWLAGVRGCRTQAERNLLFELEFCVGPAAVRGLCVSQSDADGHAAYRLTPAGREYLDNPPAVDAVELPEPDDAAAEMFLDCLLEARKELANLKSEPGIISRLSAGDWPERPAKKIPPVFLRDGSVCSLASMRAAVAKVKR